MRYNFDYVPRDSKRKPVLVSVRVTVPLPYETLHAPRKVMKPLGRHDAMRALPNTEFAKVWQCSGTSELPKCLCRLSSDRKAAQQRAIIFAEMQ